MGPFSFMAAGVSLLAKSFNVVSCTSSIARCTSLLPSVYLTSVRCLTYQLRVPPKRPLNRYMRFVIQQQPIVSKQNPDKKIVDVIRMIAHQWRELSPELKQPYEDASVRAREKFKVDMESYRAQFSPAQLEQQAQMKRQKIAKRKANRKKRELNSLGKPKRPRSPFNIFMSEHYLETQGINTQAKLKSLYEDWTDLPNGDKQVYAQLAQDDKIRYKNEMKSWETHMVEIGREDLIRSQTLSKHNIRVATLSLKRKSKSKKVLSNKFQS